MAKVFCACGCGQVLAPAHVKQGRTYWRGHKPGGTKGRKATKAEAAALNSYTPADDGREKCHCGCGLPLTEGMLRAGRYFIQGHKPKDKSLPKKQGPLADIQPEHLATPDLGSMIEARRETLRKINVRIADLEDKLAELYNLRGQKNQLETEIGHLDKAHKALQVKGNS